MSRNPNRAQIAQQKQYFKSISVMIYRVLREKKLQGYFEKVTFVKTDKFHVQLSQEKGDDNGFGNKLVVLKIIFGQRPKPFRQELGHRYVFVPYSVRKDMNTFRTLVLGVI
jgi:hypothetical protein